MTDIMMVRISNGQRLRKIQKESLPLNRRNRPHAYYKCFSYIQKSKMAKKFGYNYDSDNKVLNEMKETFQSKLDLYFPNTTVSKMGRVDKYSTKQEINFTLAMNPIQSIFQKLNQKFVRPLLRESLNSLRMVNKTQKIKKLRQ